MAALGLLALLDDITTVLDDVAVLSKIAVKKTAGIAGDDLAVGAGTVTGADPAREIPVVWAVAKGSFINKVYLIPGALLLNAVAPFLIRPLLVLGGIYLCYEGAEKILHVFLHRNGAAQKHHEKLTEALLDSPAALVRVEKEKIAAAVKTDLILSGEIVAVTLGAVAESPFGLQVVVLCGIGVIMTAGIYGLVAGIVKLDDLGFYLSKKRSLLARRAGGALIAAAPKIMKGLSVVGTAAMILVGGQLIVHHGSIFISVAAGLAAGFIAIPAVKYGGIAGRKVLSLLHRQRRES